MIAVEETLTHPEVPPVPSATAEPEPSVPRLHVLGGEGDADSESRLA